MLQLQGRTWIITDIILLNINPSLIFARIHNSQYLLITNKTRPWKKCL